MNEQMKNFYDQVGLDFENFQRVTVTKGDMEKFAELIVKECIVHGKLTQSQTVVNGSEEYNAGREMGIEVFMNQIRKHFGVEECTT